jgi:hypothetical protein
MAFLVLHAGRIVFLDILSFWRQLKKHGTALSLRRIVASWFFKIGLMVSNINATHAQTLEPGVASNHARVKIGRISGIQDLSFSLCSLRCSRAEDAKFETVILGSHTLKV